MAETVDFMSLVRQAGETVASEKQARVDIQQIMDQQQSLIASQASNLDNVASADIVISAEKNRFLAETDARKAAAEIANSSDYRNQGSDVNKWAAAARENADKAYAALDVIKEKESTTLLSNPLDYIMNKFTLPADKAEYNYYARKHNLAESTLNSLVANTTNAAVMAEKMQSSTSAEIAAAENDRILALTQKSKNDLFLKGAELKINGLSTLQNMTMNELNVGFRLQGAFNDEQRLELSKQSHALAVKDHALKQQSLALQIADRSERMEDRREQLDNATRSMNEYNIGARRVGAMEINDPKRFLSMLPTLAKDPDAVSMMVYGQKTLMNAANKTENTVMVAPTAGAAARMYASGNTQGNEVGTFLAVQYSKNEGNTLLKDPRTLEAEVTKQAVTKANLERTVIDPREPNIYSAPQIGTIMRAGVTGWTDVASAPFIRDTIVPMVNANPKVSLSDQQMLATAADYVKKNPSELNSTAAAMSNYYKLAVATNNVTKQYEANSLPNQVNYPARLKSSIGNSVYDLTSPQSWKRLIISDTMDAGAAFYPTRTQP